MDIIETIKQLKDSNFTLSLEWIGQDLVSIPITDLCTVFETLDINTEEDIDELGDDNLQRLLKETKTNNSSLYPVYKYIKAANQYGMLGGGYRVLADGLISSLIEGENTCTLRLDNCNLESDQVEYILTEIEKQLKETNLLSIQKVEEVGNCIFVEAEGEAFDSVTVQIILPRSVLDKKESELK